MTTRIFVLTDSDGYVVQESRMWWEPGIEIELPGMIELDYDPQTVTERRTPGLDDTYAVDPTLKKIIKFNVITKTWDIFYV